MLVGKQDIAYLVFGEVVKAKQKNIGNIFGGIIMSKKISVYDLLGLIKDGKAPKKIMYNDNVYEFNDYDYRCIVTEIERGFVDHRLIKNYNQNLQSSLNEKVEILEEDKPIIEKLDLFDDLQDILNSSDESIVLNAMHKCLTAEKNKLNEIIDYINRKEDK